MYLSGRSASQVTIGLVGSSTIASTLLGSAQFRFASCFSSAGVTHARSLGFAGLAPVAGAAVGLTAVGVAVGAGFVAAVSAGGNPDLGAVVDELEAFGLLVAVPVGLSGLGPVAVGTGVGVVGASTRVARIRSCDDFCNELMVAASGVPGNETTMSLPPWVETSASVTPDPFTRARMMSTAFRIWPWFICWLPTTLGVRISWVPPDRSSPSLGARWAVPQVLTAPSRP